MKGKIELFSELPPLIYKGELCFVSSIWIVCNYIVDYVRGFYFSLNIQNIVRSVLDIFGDSSYKLGSFLACFSTIAHLISKLQGYK